MCGCHYNKVILCVYIICLCCLYEGDGPLFSALEQDLLLVSHFSLTMINNHRAVLYGGTQGGHYSSDAYMLDLSTMVRGVGSSSHIFTHRCVIFRG